MSLFSLSLTLFLLMDSIGNVPIFISLLKEVKASRRQFIIFRELVIALISIIAFYFLGEYLLNLLHIGQQAILISGSIILFMIAIKLIFPTNKNGFHNSASKEPFIVPLAIPLVAGPAVLSTVMLYSHQAINTWIVVSAIVIAWVISTIILLSSSFLNRVLGPRGISACEKLTGLILVMLAVQMFLDGFRPFFMQQ